MAETVVSVRSANESDVDLIVSANQAMAWETERRRLDPRLALLGVQNGFSKPETCRYFLAVVKEQLAGQLMITPEWSDWRNAWFWWIQSVYVYPMFRKQGVFRALYQHVRTAAMEIGDVCGLRLYVETENTAAKRVYETMGMRKAYYQMYEEDWSTSSA